MMVLEKIRKKTKILNFDDNRSFSDAFGKLSLIEKTSELSLSFDMKLHIESRSLKKFYKFTFVTDFWNTLHFI